MAKKHYTFVMEEDQNRRIEICAAIESKQKSEILKEALNSYFAERAYNSVFELSHPSEKETPAEKQQALSA
jgi:polyphosphate kinase